MSDKNELGLLLLNESSDMVDTILEDGGRRGRLGLGVLGASLSESGKTLLLLELGLGLVLVTERKELAGNTLGDSVGELVDDRGDLQALSENTLLALDADHAGPFDKVGQIAGLANVSGARASNEERVGLLGLLLALGSGGLLLKILLGLSSIIRSRLGSFANRSGFGHFD